ncbi:MAG: TonB-dependent receptor [candidate division Zixibacteria bacterium]|nr:TonB-dependent receptor [candidate division Zixibacteria bacterium]
MKSILFFLGIIILITGHLIAADWRGQVTDSVGQPIEGVNILSNIPALSAVTDSNGQFLLKVSALSPTKLTFSHISYQPVMVTVGSQLIDNISVILEPSLYPGQNIKVMAERAVTGLTPIAFSDFTQGDIKRDYTISEFPLLLETTPNLYAYADAGGGLGYSYLKIRGFDDKRIAVYINGIPLNDPEDQATYFVDIPDFAADAADIQVQRGVGNSLYGDASFGGSVNIASSGLDRSRKVTLTSGWGGFYAGRDFVSQMRKQSVEFTSGLLDGRWSMTGRYSKQYSGGYRLNSWYEGWAYYLSLSRLDPHMTTTFNVYGGPMKMHLAYYGIDRTTEAVNRRVNPLGYADETDNFNQPHFELHNAYNLSDRLALRNTLYMITGKGYYEQMKNDDYAGYDIPPEVTEDSLTSGFLVRRKWVAKEQFGWNPRLDWDHRKGTASLGGSFYYFHSDHWGQVVWAEGLKKTVDPQHKYYEYYGKKYLFSLYLHEYYNLSDKVRLMGNLQLKNLRYNFDQTLTGVMPGYKYDLNWLFLSPRTGITYLLDDKTDIFFSLALSSREPEDNTIYKAEDVGAIPSLEIKSKIIHGPNDITYIFGDPTIKPERLYDFELGANYKGEKYRAGINLYWMEFRNEIIEKGGIDEDGHPVMGNADRSVHSGIELNGRFPVKTYLEISGNVSYSYNRLMKYYVYTDAGRIDYSGHPLPGFPDYIGNLICDYDQAPFRFVYRLRAIGRQYVETGKNDSLSIDPFLVSSVSSSFSFGKMGDYGRITLIATVNNLFNKKYELSGYSYEYDGHWYGEYFPAAERNFFVQLKWELE